MGQCMSDSKLTQDRFEVEKQVFNLLYPSSFDLVWDNLGPNVLLEVSEAGGGAPLAASQKEKHQGGPRCRRWLQVC